MILNAAVSTLCLIEIIDPLARLPGDTIAAVCFAVKLRGKLSEAKCTSSNTKSLHPLFAVGICTQSAPQHQHRPEARLQVTITKLQHAERGVCCKRSPKL